MSDTIVLGTLNFDYKYVSEAFTQEKINTMLEKASRLGITTLDTAYYYNQTESLLGKSPHLSKFSVASKANPWFNNDFSNGTFGQLSRIGIEHQLSTSLKNLGLECIESYFLHCWDYQTPIRETLDAFDEQYRKERFNLFGISNISPLQLQTIVEICESDKLTIYPRIYQGMYNIYCRRIEELFPVFNDHNIHFECYNPLAGGLLTGKWCEEEATGRFADNPIYQSIFWKGPVVKESGFLNADIALRWLRRHSRLRQSDSVIIGCSKLEHLENNVKSLTTETPLSNGILEKVDLFYEKTHSFQPNYYY